MTTEQLPSTDPELDDDLAAIFLDSEHGNLVQFDDNHTVKAYYEHGQWWVICGATGASWSVVDCETPTGEHYFDFEQIDVGDED